MIPVDAVNPSDLTNAIIVAGVPIVIARLIVGFTYERRSSRLWTFGLPTAALLVFLVRLILTRQFPDLVSAMDWLATLSYALLVGSQLVALSYSWWPERVTRE